MKYTAITIEFTTPKIFEKMVTDEVRYILAKIKAKEILKYARNVEVTVREETIAKTPKNNYTPGPQDNSSDQ